MAQIGSRELSVVKLEHAFTGTGVSASVLLGGRFNFSVYGGGNGTVELQRSFDNGTTWITLSRDFAGNPASYNPSANEISLIVDEPEKGMLYRVECTAFTSGTLNVRLSQ